MPPMVLLTIPEVAERLNVSATMVYRKISNGSLMPTHYGSSDLRVRAHILERYIQASTRSVPAARRTARRGAARRTASARPAAR